MKKILFAASLLSSASAFAFTDLPALTCKDVAGGPDHGYLIYVKKDRYEANVHAQTIAGPKLVSNLHCEPNADSDTILECLGSYVNGSSLTLKVKLQGVHNPMIAKLSKISIAGTKVIATLECNAAE